VILACRDETKALQAVSNIEKSLGAACKVSFIKLDLASLQSVRDFAAAFNASKFRFYMCLLVTVVNFDPTENITASNEHKQIEIFFVQLVHFLQLSTVYFRLGNSLF